MPAKQAGSYYRVSGGWGVRWYERRRHAASSRASTRRARRATTSRRSSGRGSTASRCTRAADLAPVLGDRYIARYEAIRAPATVRALKWRLVSPLEEFGDTPLDELRVGEIAAWEASLPPRFRHDVMRAIRMVGKAAVDWGYLASNPTRPGEPRAARDRARRSYPGRGRRARRGDVAAVRRGRPRRGVVLPEAK